MKKPTEKHSVQTVTIFLHEFLKSSKEPVYLVWNKLLWMEGILLSALCILHELLVPSCWDGSPAVLAVVPPLCSRGDVAATFISRLQLFWVIINESSTMWIWSVLHYTLIALNAVKNCERIMWRNGKKKESFKTCLWFITLRWKAPLSLTLVSSLFQLCGFVFGDMCGSWTGVFILVRLQCAVPFPSQGSCCLVLSSFGAEMCVLVLTALFWLRSLLSSFWDKLSSGVS